MIFPPADLDKMRTALSSGAPVLVSSHVHPDPDAIGSVLAVREMLHQLGAVPHVILNDPVPPRCRFLPGAEEIVSYPAAAVTERFRVAVVVDSGSLSRIGDVEQLLEPGAVVMNLDHHLSNDRFGAINFVSLECAATGELLYLLCRELGLTVTRTLADNLFAGILTDTGRFRYPNTTSRTLHVAADLVASGAAMTRIADSLYYDIAPADVYSTGRIYSTLELFAGGLISTMFVRLDNRVEDPDTVVDTALSIRGVQVAVLLTETTEGKIRVSLRSKQYVNVSAIAESFGGGGHEKAAGFRRHGTLESVRAELLPVLLDAVAAGARKPAVEEL